MRMITKDISLEDCILDLIDNCLDGAHKARQVRGSAESVDYRGFRAQVELSGERFRIVDNCGGITIAEAIDYAFHFGRRLDAPPEGEYSIGLYGIGMKRALFKIGNKIEIYSSTDKEAFRTKIDVKDWLTRAPTMAPGETVLKEDWDFDMEDAEVNPETGTSIEIGELYTPISKQFANAEFANSVARIVARDYAQFLAKGFEISINGKKIEAFRFTVAESDDFKPIRTDYVDESGVNVEIIAGMAGRPPDDLQPTERRMETEYYGWFVICNDRVVVASDTTNRTVWGDGDFPNWHFQYNGFIGVVLFTSKDPNLLPWTTTKRDVDRSNATYRRAIEKMKDVTRLWIKYTNDRKANIAVAKDREASASAKPLFTVERNSTLQVPRLSRTAELVSYTWIQYKKPSSEVAKVKKMLRNSSMPNYRVGEMTFDYYVKSESED